MGERTDNHIVLNRNGKQTLEQRILTLESQVAELRVELQRLKNCGVKDWRRTIGAFTDNAEMQSMLCEAMRLREMNRKKSRRMENSE